MSERERVPKHTSLGNNERAGGVRYIYVYACDAYTLLHYYTHCSLVAVLYETRTHAPFIYTYTRVRDFRGALKLSRECCAQSQVLTAWLIIILISREARFGPRSIRRESTGGVALSPSPSFIRARVYRLAEVAACGTRKPFLSLSLSTFFLSRKKRARGSGDRLPERGRTRKGIFYYVERSWRGRRGERWIEFPRPRRARETRDVSWFIRDASARVAIVSGNRTGVFPVFRAYWVDAMWNLVFDCMMFNKESKYFEISKCEFKIWDSDVIS